MTWNAESMSPTHSVENFTFESGGLTLVGQRRPGSASRPPLVFLHGGGQTRHSWDRTGLRLAESGWETVELDARGHGESDWDPGGDYLIDAFVGDLVTFLRRLGRPAVLIGASLGGIVSLTVAGEHPELVAALVLVDVVIRVEPRGVERIRAFMTANPAGFASLEEVADAIAAYNPNRPRPRSLEGLRKNVRLGEDGRWRWHWDPAFMSIPDEPQRLVRTERLEAAADRIAAPTLIVRGMRSDIVSDSGLEDMRRRVPAARTVEVGAAGHMVAGDDNDVFSGALEEFLRGLD
jgi:pimeloyl-ACP methyl ester carboxylesterase